MHWHATALKPAHATGNGAAQARNQHAAARCQHPCCSIIIITAYLSQLALARIQLLQALQQLLLDSTQLGRHLVVLLTRHEVAAAPCRRSTSCCCPAAGLAAGASGVAARAEAWVAACSGLRQVRQLRILLRELHLQVHHLLGQLAEALAHLSSSSVGNNVACDAASQPASHSVSSSTTRLVPKLQRIRTAQQASAVTHQR